jgi:hypothetical protein
MTHEIIFDKQEFIEKAKVRLREKQRFAGKALLTLEESCSIGIELGH